MLEINHRAKTVARNIWMNITIIIELTVFLLLILMSCQDIIRKSISKIYVCICVLLGIGGRCIREINLEEMWVDFIVAIIIISLLVFVYMSKFNQIGTGDVWVMFALLFVLGGRAFLIMISFCMFIVMLFSMGIYLIKRVPKNYQIPLIPFLTIGTFLCLIVKR